MRSNRLLVTMIYSLIIPVYRNEASLPELLDTLKKLNKELNGLLEAVFVVDGSPDESHAILRRQLPVAPFASQLHLLSRNFGSFAAIRSGLAAARGDYFAVLAADLQEPPELALQFFRMLEADHADIVIGTRVSREDPWISRIASTTFWGLYRRLINADIPAGGVDVFGCNDTFRQQLLSLEEHHSSLIGLIFWLGFRRQAVTYTRRLRKHGKSAWTLRRKINYMMDSIFAFTDLPIRLLLALGTIAMSVAIIFGSIVLLLRIFGQLEVPGYTATILTVLFFGGLNSLGLGVIGAYVWRAYSNTQRRPLDVVMKSQSYPGEIESR